MSYPHGPYQPSVTESERDRAEEWLKEAYVAGRLSESELDARLGQAMQARDRRSLTASLVGVVPPAQAVMASVPRPAATRGTGLAAVAHFSVFFLWLLGPALCYAVAAPGSYARREAAKAFNFQLVALVAIVTTAIVTGALGIGQAVVPLGALAWFVLTIIGGVKASAGENWRNPVMRVVRWEVLGEQRR